MGYCAKVRIFSQYLCVIVLFINYLMKTVHCASAVPAKTWPKLKTYDIWGPSPSIAQNANSMHIKRSTFTSSNDLLLQEHRDKTSFRNGKVLNFFAQPAEDECKSDDGLRSGVCMNVYECHQKGGTARGECALGFGSCCVFIATCDQEIKNNITYFISPKFPALMSSDMKTCKLKIKMMSSDISQLRFDFMHFSIGQPNRFTGNCDGDIFSIFGGALGDFKLCGYNNGQHIYYDVPNRKARDTKMKDIDVVMNFTSAFGAARFWEVRVSQIPFSQRAPTGCLQYFYGNEGTIQTFNFAENGRHLANQKYKSCIRQEKGMCSIAYEPCDERSFRIGPKRRQANYPISPYSTYNAYPYQPNPYQPNPYYGNPALNGPIIGPNGMLMPNPYATNAVIPPNRIVYDANGMPSIIDPNGMLIPINPNALTAQMGGIPLTVTNGAGGGGGGGGQPVQADPGNLNANNGTAPSNDGTNTTLTTTTSTTTPLYDDVEGSGDEDEDEISQNPASPATNPANPGNPTNTQNQQKIANPNKNEEDDEDDEDGENDLTSLFSIGSFITRAALFRRSIRSVEPKRKSKQFFTTCDDRITFPCIVEDFISVSGTNSVPGCSPVHCGNSLCAPGISPCRVESTVTPFGIGINFGDGLDKGSPEENIGACIRYKQLNCV